MRNGIWHGSPISRTIAKRLRHRTVKISTWQQKKWQDLYMDFKQECKRGMYNLDDMINLLHQTLSEQCTRHGKDIQPKLYTTIR